MTNVRRKLLCGVGIKDTEGVVKLFETIPAVDSTSGKKRVCIWTCPFYSVWSAMILRCYSDEYKRKNPSYIDVSSCEEWKRFSNFKAWMEQQDWEGKQLDKDLLVRGNRIYSPETCCFLSREVNSFIMEKSSCRGQWPIGVHWNISTKKFHAQVGNPFTGKQEYIGIFSDPLLAHEAWLKRKTQLAFELANEQTDVKISSAIVDRYLNYKTTNKE